MEAIAIQVVSKEVDAALVGPENGSDRAPGGAFSALVDELIAAEEETATDVSEDVTPALDETEEETDAGNEGILPSFVAAFTAGSEGLGEKIDSGDASSPAEADQGVTSGHLGKEATSGPADILPGSVDGEFPGAFGQMVAEVASGGQHPGVPGYAFGQAVAELASGRQPLEISGQEIPSGAGEGELADSLGQATSPVSEAIRARGGHKNAADQGLGAKPNQGIEVPSMTNPGNAEETPQAPPVPSLPKEAIEVESLSLASSEEHREAEVEPVEPLEDGHVPQPDKRSAEGLEAAKTLAQPQSTASTREASTVNRPPASPIVERLVEKVVETVQAGSQQERHEITLQLNPPSLGKVHLRVLVEDSKLHVALYTATSEARDLVESNATQLKTALHQQGLELEQFSVEVRSGLAHNMGEQDWSSWREDFASGPFFRAPGAVSKELAAGPWSYAGGGGLSRIDLFI